MHFLIDFDYTIFDTNRMRTLLAKRLEVNEQEFMQTEQQIKAADELYTPESHCKLLAIDPSRFHTALLEIAGECLYPDALSFFDEYVEAKMTILTFGNVAWQEQKIEASGIAEIVQDIVTTDIPKEEVICQWENEHDMVIINDRGSEIDSMAQVLPDAQYVLLQRPGTPYVDEFCMQPSLRVTTFSEINLSQL